MINTNTKIAYFGGSPIGKPVLAELLKAGIKPEVVVTSPDKPSGRGHQIHGNDLKAFAQKHSLNVLQPTSISRDEEELSSFFNNQWDLFVVVAYPKILPEWFLNIPKHGAINLHPSLLPKYRGVSPIRSAILNDDRDIGVSVILLDEEMDHGPILEQAFLEIADVKWPIDGTELDQQLADLGGKLLAEAIPAWLSGDIIPQEQDHGEATYTQKFTRQDGELKLDPFSLPTGKAAYQTLLKIRAFSGFPGTYFFYKNKRVKVIEAELSDSGQLSLLTVRPEGKNDISFSDWLLTQA